MTVPKFYQRKEDAIPLCRSDATPLCAYTEASDARMYTIMKSFFPNATAVVECMSDTHSFIAGSAPLYAIKPWNEDGFDGDIDIWCCAGNIVGTVDGKPHYTTDSLLLDKVAQAHWKTVLTAQGYIVDFKVPPSRTYISQESMRSVIQKVIHYVHPTTNRRVQVIMCRERSMRAVLAIFDYTFCAVAWDGGRFYSEYLNDIMTGKGRIVNRDKLLKGREEKYAARGFTLVSSSA